ncbi:MAG: hypothetical protein IJJ58_05520 [Campylobacter sp.]|nr:hypothetical protein [Campylobacter sp.]
MPSYIRAVEKTRTREAIQVLSSISLSEDNYKLSSNEYTDKVQNFNLVFKNFDTGNQASGNSFKGEHFDYVVYGQMQPLALARRNNGEYELSVNYEEKKYFCQPSSHYICKEFGFPEMPVINEEPQEPEVPVDNPIPQEEPTNPCQIDPTSQACCEYSGDCSADEDINEICQVCNSPWLHIGIIGSLIRKYLLLCDKYCS